VQFRLFTDIPFEVTLSVGIAILAALLVLLIGFALLSYRRNREHLRRGWFYSLLALRCLAAVLLLVALLDPVVATSAKRRKGALVFLVDNSQSMQTRDSTGGMTRLQTARDLLFGADGVVKPLREDFEVLPYEFGKEVMRIVPRRPLRSATPTTDFQEALRFANNLSRAKEAAAIIAISDGQNNVHKEDQLLEMKMQAPVFCIGIGKKESDSAAQPDLDVRETLAKRVMMQHTKYSLDLSLEKRNLSPSEIRLHVTEGDSPISEHAISLDSSSGAQQASLEFIPKETGLHRFKLTATALPNEATLANNSRYFTVNVVNPRLKVLYFEGRPRWEFKFLRRALETSPDTQILSMVRTTSDAFYVQGQTEELPLLSGFPASLEELLKFDVLILGSGGRELLSSSNLSDIVEFIDRGKGLIVLGSPDLPGLMGTQLERVLPAIVAQGRIATPFQLQLTPQGKVHPVMKGLAEVFVSDARLSRFKGRVALGAKKQGAISLATGDSQDVILIQPYGKGRVLLLAPDSSWEWYLALEGAGYGSVYGRFYQQAVRWASGYQLSEEDKTFPIIIYTDKDYYELDEPVMVEMQTTLPLSEIELSWGTADDAARALPFTETAGQTGRFVGKLHPENIGEYQVQVSYKNEKRQLWFTVGNPLAETTRLELNDSLLKKIALSSSGKYFDLTEKRELLRNLRSLAIVRRTAEQEASLWDSPYPYLIFVAACALEWFFRRRKQLI
jgi:hypothetical protein